MDWQSGPTAGRYCSGGVRCSYNAGMSAAIRPARVDDLPRLTEIYNYYVLNSHVTFDLEPATLEERRLWFKQFATQGTHRLLVAEENGVVVAYAGSFRFRSRRAYDETVETTVYCAPEAVGRGIGSALYGALFDALRGEPLHAAIAALGLPNPASVALHERFGFQLVGVMREVGRKFGRYWDVAWYEKKFP
jgi:phosphinothricin acetyltransferase